MDHLGTCQPICSKDHCASESSFLSELRHTVTMPENDDPSIVGVEDSSDLTEAERKKAAELIQVSQCVRSCLI